MIEQEIIMPDRSTENSLKFKQFYPICQSNDGQLINLP